jgi:hypothetical protein
MKGAHRMLRTPAPLPKSVTPTYEANSTYKMNFLTWIRELQKLNDQKGFFLFKLYPFDNGEWTFISVPSQDIEVVDDTKTVVIHANPRGKKKKDIILNFARLQSMEFFMNEKYWFFAKSGFGQSLFNKQFIALSGNLD